MSESVVPFPSAADPAAEQAGAAMRVLKGRAARQRAAAGGGQTDLEGYTGVAAEQEAREAEAGGIAADRLRSIVERIERLEEERAALAADIKDIRLEAKSAGFCVKTIATILKLRKKEPAEVDEAEHMLALYRRALGM